MADKIWESDERKFEVLSVLPEAPEFTISGKRLLSNLRFTYPEPWKSLGNHFTHFIASYAKRLAQESPPLLWIDKSSNITKYGITDEGLNVRIEYEQNIREE